MSSFRPFKGPKITCLKLYNFDFFSRGFIDHANFSKKLLIFLCTVLEKENLTKKIEIELKKIYMIDSNVSSFENQKNVENHSTLYCTLPSANQQ